MLLRRFNYPKTTGLILRRTYPDLYKSHVIKLFEEYPEIAHWYHADPKEMVFPNGSRLFFGYAEHERDMNSFYSAEFADILVDEAQEFSQGELERLAGSNRCTSNQDITPKMVCTFMPGISESGLPPKGLTYLKRVFVDHDLRPEEQNERWAFVQAFSWDNVEWARPELERDEITEEEFYSWTVDERREYSLNRTAYGRKLSAITDKSLRDAWLYGKWDVFEGQYFPQFSRDKHTYDPNDVKLPPWYTRWISGDWGYEHPHAIYWHAKDENNHVWTYREMYGRRLSETDLGQQITRLSAGEKLKSFPFSWDAGKLSPRSQPKVPKSMMQMVSDALGSGVPKPHPADSSPGTRVSGARLMAQLLDAGMWHISRDCVKLIECLPTLIRDMEKNSEDVLKVDHSENQIGDDPYDAARMGLQHMLGANFKPKNVQLQERLLAVNQSFLPAVAKADDFFTRFGGKVIP